MEIKQQTRKLQAHPVK